ncbi:MAG: archaeal heat shock protein Hsp20 [Candidatus Altiarchaeota archaeon]
MDDPSRRRRRFFEGMFDDDLFDMFDEEVRRMEEHMSFLFDEMSRRPEGGGMRKYVYGFTMRPGPDGSPVLEEFGNVPRSAGEQIPGEREPLVDVIDGKEEVSVIAELPGVDKKDIDLEADQRTLSISVDTPNRKYHKELRIPSEVDPESIKAAYKNGVLEVKLKKTNGKSGGKRIQVD